MRDSTVQKDQGSSIKFGSDHITSVMTNSAHIGDTNSLSNFSRKKKVQPKTQTCSDAAPSQQLTFEQVTPELAAKIVKCFVLPMFETSQGKLLRRKQQKFKQIGMACSTALGDLPMQQSQSQQSQMHGSTVLQELNLTQTLAEELHRVREQMLAYERCIDELKENARQAQQGALHYKAQLAFVRKKFNLMRHNLELSLKTNVGLKNKIVTMSEQHEELIQTNLLSERARTKFS